MSAPLPFHLLPDNATVGDRGQLVIGGCDLLDLAEEFGTPLFVYDEDHLRARAREAVAAFGDHATYASKAFLCRAMARLVHEEGMSIDVATGGEMAVALAADVPAGRLHLHGNNKSGDELREAMAAGVGRIIVDSFDEMDRIEALVAAGSPAPRVLLRVTPGVKAETHEFVATGQDDSKFGFTVATGVALEAVRRAEASDAMDLVGIHCHIGSQVFEAESFAKALAVLATFTAPLDLPELVIGGGLGVPYVTGEQAPSISDWAAELTSAAASLGITATLGIEPGRAIAAAAAVTLYTVGTVKPLEGIRTYVAVDGGMSDNPRPVLYGSGYETFLPRAVEAERPQQVRVVGKHCESGDILVRDAQVPSDLAVGDVLATPVTGAYGHSMGSNYNKVLRPPVVFVRDGDARLVVRRETPEDLLRTDVG
ncbi:Diaminopimelate decarboxylase [Euzebya pacifica]|uniref:Diaminopimelate decarboxylase n=1 Tax=Euzebya pacifica TaxID=1608957 RepID=A0A346Y1V8_9ACTN|nr:diaminopimelate decarboxylase [Euzebya pacifica]AXV08455.1 Diaminopimelate decarboxylase [Euzebya pacifica]